MSDANTYNRVENLIKLALDHPSDQIKAAAISFFFIFFDKVSPGLVRRIGMVLQSPVDILRSEMNPAHRLQSFYPRIRKIFANGGSLPFGVEAYESWALSMLDSSSLAVRSEGLDFIFHTRLKTAKILARSKAVIDGDRKELGDSFGWENVWRVEKLLGISAVLLAPQCSRLANGE